jgi:hypothetical protein
MATSAPIGRERAMQLVAEGALPVLLGSPQPNALILEQERKLRIRELVIDRLGAQAAAAAAHRARSPSWMPEHYYAAGQPTGKIFAEAATRAELLDVMRTMSWPTDW